MKNLIYAHFLTIMQPDDHIITWLLEGDVSIQYQTQRDLLDTDRTALRNRIAKQGWGKQFLEKRKEDGHWGQKFYQPKWISTHYTLLDLKNLNINPDQKQIKQSLEIVFAEEKAEDGGILAIGEDKKSDVCVNGMVLNYAAYFGVEAEKLQSLIDFLIAEQMPDGGFNCHSNRKGAVHSSMHSTISVLEGIEEYKRNGYIYRLKELEKVKHTAEEFILMHKLYKSDKTGEIINKRFLKLCYPCRWYYDILRALEYFRYSGRQYDSRMEDAINFLLGKKTKSGVWNLAAKHPGQLHFEMETAGKASRWNTLRTLRVLKEYAGI